MGMTSKTTAEDFYRRLVAEQRESGLSVRGFAARRGIPAGTLSYWRHELKRRDAVGARAFVRVDVSPTQPQCSAFGQMETSSEGPVVYEILLGRDRVLRVPAGFDERRVAALVRAVAPC